MAYDDFEPEDYDEPDDEPHGRESWRPHSRAGMGSLALAALGALSLTITAGGADPESFLGITTKGITCLSALLGLILGIAGCLQRDLRRGYALLGTVLNAGLLAMALALGS
jgi:hypothetical protein